MKIPALCFSIAAIFLLSSCGNDDAAGIIQTPGQVVVVNEGNFGQSNGSLTTYDPETGKTLENTFQTANNRPLGDVVQSMYFSGGTGYVVVNNSRKIEVVDAIFMSTATIEEGLANPRFLLKAEARLFVSNWGNFDENFALDQSYVLILDSASFEVEGRVDTEDGTENLAYSDGFVYAANSFTNTVSVLNAGTGTLSATLETGFSPGEMVVGSDGTVWLICGGNYQANDGAIYKLGPAQSEVEVNLGSNPSAKLAIDQSAGLLYFINGTSVGKYSTETKALTSSFITENGAVGFYGIGFSEEEQVLYVADAQGFQGKGKVYRYSNEGNLLSTFDAGVGPNSFVFRKN